MGGWNGFLGEWMDNYRGIDKHINGLFDVKMNE